jgi:predicted RNA-binding protein with PUA-like domain
VSKAWVFKVQPKEWDVNRFIKDQSMGTEKGALSWIVHEHADQIASGDRVYFWREGDDRQAGIVALATVTGAPQMRPENQVEYRKKAAPEEKYEGKQCRAVIEIERVLRKPLYRVKMEWTDGLKEMSVLQESDDTTFPVRPAEVKIIEKLADALR